MQDLGSLLNHYTLVEISKGIEKENKQIFIVSF